jgi:hypothetical protein
MKERQSMNQRVFTMCAALACAAFAIALAPIAPAAVAGGGHHGHDLDPAAQVWYDFAHDKAQEINLLRIRASHSLYHKTHRAVDAIYNHCCIIRCVGCCGSKQEDQRQRRIRKSIARRAKFEVGKCVWEAQMELDACYEDARQQLEDAGHEYFFIEYVYSPYRTVQRHLVGQQRNSQNYLNAATHCVP